MDSGGGPERTELPFHRVSTLFIQDSQYQISFMSSGDRFYVEK